MSKVADYREQLLGLDRSEWPAFLDAHSGLPGPRSNLELIDAYASLADRMMIEELLATGDEYRSSCAVVALGNSAEDPTTLARLKAFATDDRWRVRESVAIALQHIGDRNPEELSRIVLEWAADSHPLVQRAAMAAICEPRLLRTPIMAATAVGVCRRATASLAESGPTAPSDIDTRVLRQALGYGWSVAIAAAPGPGMKSFLALDELHPDVAWIIRENRKKKRIEGLI